MLSFAHNFQKNLNSKIKIELDIANVEFQAKLDINNVKFQSKGILLHVHYKHGTYINIFIYPHVKGMLNSALQHIPVLTRAFVSKKKKKKKKKTRALDNSLSSQCLDPILALIVKFIRSYDVTSSYEL